MMAQPTIAPYGSWVSPLRADLVSRSAVSLGELVLGGDTLYWIENRPAEGGRSAIMRLTRAGQMDEVLPAPFSARSRVHEYGGGAFWTDGETVYFVNFSDQQIYRLEAGREPAALTPPVTAMRYADGFVDQHRQRIICVREDHSSGGEAVNSLVSIALDGGDGAGRLLVGGNDFYASATLSPDGSRLAWLTWNHPNMPWDGTELWVGSLDAEGNVVESTLVAGGEGESIFQPEWSPDGELYFVSDHSGWWNLFRWRDGWSGPLYQREAEFGVPQWVFGQATYGFAGAGRVVTLYFERGRWQLGLLEPDSAAFTPMLLPYSELSGIQVGDGFAVMRAGSPAEPSAIVRVNLRTQQIETVREVGRLEVPAGYFSIPEAIEFPTRDGETAHAYHYPPQNQDYRGAAGELPPLLVNSHGGPTSRAGTAHDLDVQFWTSRGFAVLDVNYRGSTGYGREYREKLKGNWGVLDVTDCIDGARYLARRRRVDGERVAIRGGSAGGYTTLCALTFHDFFRAGASYFGVSDVGALARDTHKFESRYLDPLVGRVPNQEERYVERSPIHFTGQLSCPIIFFQGLEDRVVPPSQAELMVAALRKRGLPVAYLAFEGEYHGFRRAESIRRALEAELYFYGRIFGFQPADQVEPVPIENLED
jgi:dipeptidyl aminopeptidase/acylaminoacyl peptidase